MRALGLMLFLMIAGLMTFRAVLFSVDFSRFKEQIVEAGSGPGIVPSREDLSAKALAESVAGFARVFGFTVSAEAVQVFRKPEYQKPSEELGKGPTRLHDYQVTVTVSRWVLPFYTRTEKVVETTSAPCVEGHYGNGQEVFIADSPNP